MYIVQTGQWRWQSHCHLIETSALGHRSSKSCLWVNGLTFFVSYAILTVILAQVVGCHMFCYVQFQIMYFVEAKSLSSFHSQLIISISLSATRKLLAEMSSNILKYVATLFLLEFVLWCEAILSNEFNPICLVMRGLTLKWIQSNLSITCLKSPRCLSTATATGKGHLLTSIALQTTMYYL